MCTTCGCIKKYKGLIEFIELITDKPIQPYQVDILKRIENNTPVHTGYDLSKGKDTTVYKNCMHKLNSKEWISVQDSRTRSNKIKGQHIQLVIEDNTLYE